MQLLSFRASHGNPTDNYGLYKNLGSFWDTNIILGWINSCVKPPPGVSSWEISNNVWLLPYLILITCHNDYAFRRHKCGIELPLDAWLQWASHVGESFLPLWKFQALSRELILQGCMTMCMLTAWEVLISRIYSCTILPREADRTLHSVRGRLNWFINWKNLTLMY